MYSGYDVTHLNSPGCRFNVRLLKITLLLLTLQLSQLAAAAHDYDLDSHEGGEFCDFCLQISPLGQITIDAAPVGESGAKTTSLFRLPQQCHRTPTRPPFNVRAPPHSV